MKWTTKNGQVLEISDMTDSHITNTIAHITKRILEIKEDKFEIIEIYSETEYNQAIVGLNIKLMALKAELIKRTGND